MVEELYRLCVNRGYFTCGTSEQYQRMFHMARNGATAHDIALVIWICSDGRAFEFIEVEVEDILNKYGANSDEMK